MRDLSPEEAGDIVVKIAEALNRVFLEEKQFKEIANKFRLSGEATAQLTGMAMISSAIAMILSAYPTEVTCKKLYEDVIHVIEDALGDRMMR